MFKRILQFGKENKRKMSILCGVLSLTLAFGSNWFTLGYDVYRNGEKKETVSSDGMLTAQAKAERESYLKIVSKAEVDAKVSAGKNKGKKICVLSLDGQAVFGVDREETLEKILNEYKKKYQTSGWSAFDKVATWEMTFNNDVPKYSEKKAREVLTGENGEEALLHIVGIEYEEWEEEVPFETTYENTDSLKKGQTQVKTEGKNGIIRHQGYVVRKNQDELSRWDSKKETVSDPVDAVVLVGTRDSEDGVGSGTFAIPCSGTVSSGFGARWGRNHNGVDLAAPNGTDITAADSGTVVSAGWNSGGYGNLVIIDHGDGTQTYYAHCSELLVSKGETVEKGELIAKVGSTGRSTGNHLHFEIRVNGSPVNPANYLSL